MYENNSFWQKTVMGGPTLADRKATYKAAIIKRGNESGQWYRVELLSK